jgi:hypothetical protein
VLELLEKKQDIFVRNRWNLCNYSTLLPLCPLSISPINGRRVDSKYLVFSLPHSLGKVPGGRKGEIK